MFKTPEETSMTDDWAQFHQQELEKQKVGLSTAALRVRIQTSLKNTKMGDISKKI
jgi:hypothetical protein